MNFEIPTKEDLKTLLHEEVPKILEQAELQRIKKSTRVLRRNKVRKMYGLGYAQ